MRQESYKRVHDAERVHDSQHSEKEGDELKSQKPQHLPHDEPRRTGVAWIGQWYGVILTAAVAVSALWLVITGQHTLFIHPRYSVFLAEMAILAGIASMWALWRGVPQSESHHHPGAVIPETMTARPSEMNPSERATDSASLPATASAATVEYRQGKGNRATLASAATAVLVGTALVLVTVVPPAPLSPSMAMQRGGTGGAGASYSNLVRGLADLPPEPNISHWAQLLTIPHDDDLSNVPARITGFVTTNPDIADQGYYLVRFTVVCCAVDAYPAAVPIYDPMWREHVEVGQWLDVSGAFQPVEGKLPEKYILHPDSVTPIEEPAEPYLF